MRYSIPAYSKTSRLDVATTNKVLRNTYTLLAITLLPAIVGGAVGAVFPLFAAIGFISFIVFLAAIFGLQAMIIKNRNSVRGIGWLLLLTFVMGYFIGPMVGYALGSYSNGAELVALAIGGTAAIFFGVAGYASVTKRDFSSPSIGKMLSISMWMVFAIACLNFFFVSSAVMAAVSSLFIVISSVFILFTINKIVRGGEDNYIMATTAIFIMLFNLFQSLLSLLMIFAGNRE